jgi:tRNA threonylcarbamoyl adenosine modification protein (Sua5/YciO/YrdC/YwlC family)
MGRVIDEVVAALQSGKPVVMPMDTVYGLCASPYREEHVRRLYSLKGRDPLQPMALVACDLEMLFECVPEMRGRSGTIARALLPGPYTLVLPNPARRFRWLTGLNQDAIGVRVPVLAGDAVAVLERVGAVAATSANHSGDLDPARFVDVPAEIRAACAAGLDGGELQGVPSTVIDCTGPEPQVLREGAGQVDEALAAIAAAG